MNAKPYLICLRCNSEEFTPKPDAVFEQIFKGKTLKVPSPGMACQYCGYVALGANQLDELRKRTADIYRQKHGLLTSAEIKGYREQLGLSQRQFADCLEAGEASVKRWETWLVQERSSDRLIRLTVQQLLKERQARQSPLHWLAGTCTRTVVVVTSVGIQLPPKKQPVAPVWSIAGAARQAQPPQRRNVAYDPALPVAA